MFAMQGTLEDYRMARPSTIAFQFGRFDAVTAGARNVSALGGHKGHRHHHTRPGQEVGTSTRNVHINTARRQSLY